VTPFRKDLVLEAIQRELHRGGQVFFVHNEVETIAGAAQRLAELVPSARIRVAHGQMRERLLEQTMRDFYHRRFDILVCSTIIETGIDIPTANTIMIHRADRFGLAQLHQLRGRVGRSIHQAYAFLFIPEFDTQAEEARSLTSEARQRLDAMVQHQALGSGFALAMQDLEIRGAGVLLGDAQSGHIQALGYRLYLEILEQAVSRLKSGSDSLEYSEHQKARDIRNIEIDLPISALIPDRYLNDVGFRLTCYDQIDHAKGLRELSDIQAEMTDRFGALPVQTQALFGLARLRFQCYNLGISGIKSGKQSGVIQFNNKPNIKLDRLIDLIQNQPDQFKLVDQQHLRFTVSSGGGSGSWEASDWFKYFDQIFSDLA
jgi:transcription-repair coupling factor (superfamily II helicase)